MNSFILQFQRTSFTTHPIVVSTVLFVAALIFFPRGFTSGPIARNVGNRDVADVDSGLQRAADLALGQREGVVIVMDAQTGRIRAMANPMMLADKAFAPGSTIKPFAALAALRLGLITDESRLSCRETYRMDDFEINCSHPKDQPPFSPVEALAYSCNYFFGEVGARLSEAAFNRTLTSFGFSSRTGFSANESIGELPHSSRNTSNTLGEGGSIKATPLQLITAYAALINGGHLLVARQASHSDFVARERSRLEIESAFREIVIDGMRGAVEYGTAQKAGLVSLPLNIIGKTGTSTASDSARTQGWFVGFASDEASTDKSAPESIKLAVLVFLKRAHGADCAEASRVVFDEFARSGSRGDTEAYGRSDTEQVVEPARLANLSLPVRVHMVRENVTRTMSLEEYVLGVVSAEGSTENELESLKALAVASRTYALKNIYRHRNDGYDFCTTTHCQRFFAVDHTDARSTAVQAVEETAGEVLRDASNQIVESYFSASCGGITADIRTLWGSAPKTYLRGSRDENCDGTANSSWTDVIPADKLAVALQADPRSDVGKRLHDVRIIKRDATGRAEIIELTGERRRTLRGWDFKIIVGRSLGWNLLKSSRFEISRSETNFIFRGSGFGHGLGLCQEGAHVMAANGAHYRQILSRYFPGTTLRKENFGSEIRSQSA